MKFRVTLEGRLVSNSGSIDDDAREALLRAMSELNKLGWAGNAACLLNSSSGSIKLVCAVEAEGPREAVQPASDNIFLALHHGKIGTPDWPEPEDPRWRVEFVNTRSEALL